MEMNKLPPETVGAIAALAAAGLETFAVEGVPHAILPPGYKLENFAHLLDAPKHIEAHVKLVDAKSFIDYFQKFATDSTVIFANEDGRTITAVFDYHDCDGPAWGKHNATLSLTHSKEWKAWIAVNGKRVPQRDFAEFIEDNLKDIVEPVGATLLEVAKTLQASKTLSFRSGTELSNGQVQFQYNEVIKGEAGATGELTIPTKIKLGLRVFKGMDAYAVEARFRYRIDPEGALSFSYHLDNLDKVLEDAFEQVLNQVKVGCNGAQLFKQ